MKKAIILLSGGMDSATALYWALKEGYEITALSINFYMRSPHERDAVLKLVERTRVKLIEVDVPFIKEASNLDEEKYPLPYKKYPEGFVPLRNILFYSIAAYYAEISNIDTIIGGHLASDPKQFPDATIDFFKRVEDLLNQTRLTTANYKVHFLIPFAKMTKTQVAQLADKLSVPLEVTWSCYWDEPKPCGACTPCKERAEAFQQAKLIDRALFPNSIK